MVQKSIRDLVEQQPFEPFRIRANSGAAYEVRNPGVVAIMKSRVMVAEQDSDNYALIPLPHIAGIEVINGNSGKST